MCWWMSFPVLSSQSHSFLWKYQFLFLQFYFDIWNNWKKKKKECHSSCLNCSGGGENDCLSCEMSLYYENGRCVNQCSIGFYQNDNSHICDSCPNVCLACSSRTLYFSFLLFFQYSWTKSFNNIHIKLPAEMCSSCIEGYSLNRGECVVQCPDGLNSNDGICSRIYFLSLFSFLLLLWQFWFLNFFVLPLKITETQTQNQTQNQGILNIF